MSTNDDRERASLMVRIGEPVDIAYINEGAEWRVSLTHGDPMPLHGHFGDLDEGLAWLADMAEKRREEK